MLHAPAAQAAPGDGPGGVTLNPTSGSNTTVSMGQATSAIACPTTHRYTASFKIVRAGTPVELLVTLSGNIFGLSDTPPSAPMDVLGAGGLERNFAEKGLSSGDYEVGLVCFGSFGAVWTVAANTWIHVDLAAGTWNVIDGGGGAVTTTTTLAAQPTNAQAGAPVALTATVTGAGAAGNVEFLDGSTSLGTDDVSGGTATLSVNTLSAGQHSLTAKFVPTDPEAFTASTSSAVTVTITAGSGGGNGGQTVNVTVPQSGGSGVLSLAVDDTAVQLSQVTAGELKFKGDLSAITVTDGRPQADLDGWEVQGETSDFTGGGNTFGGENLGWTPKVITQNGAGDVVAGGVVAPGDPGLKVAKTLASADDGKGAGQSKLGGTLDLQVPAATQPGNYSATLTVTLMSK